MPSEASPTLSAGLIAEHLPQRQGENGKQRAAGAEDVELRMANGECGKADRDGRPDSEELLSVLDMGFSNRTNVPPFRIVVGAHREDGG